MLYEMLQGDVLKDGWKDKQVKDALDLCLACKGCKNDCPVNVDMATYKSEFLSHYYDGRLRPRTAYIFGWIYWWSRLASLMPGAANFFMHAPVISRIIKEIAGITQHRKMPKYAQRTFKSWFEQRKKSKLRHDSQRKEMKRRVILWADTFNNYFIPQTLVAGVEVLEAAGFEVVVPQQSLCCGRPLYDFGMLTTAKKMLLQIMKVLKEDIIAGTPIVGLEPSCVAVFRDELHNLFPHDENASRLSQQVFTLGEFLEKKAPHFNIPEINSKAIVHGHCHHRSIMKLDSELKVLDKTGLSYEILPTSCCGMAGYFGYEKGRHYEVSIQAGEQLLLPAVRGAEKTTLIIADGFSCREQIAQGTDRKAMHLAQVLQMGLTETNKKVMHYPEKKYVEGMQLNHPQRTRNYLLFVGIMLSFVTTYLLLKQQKS